MNHNTRTQSTTIKESVPRTLDLLEAIFEVLPLRVGLFLPPLMVVAEMSGEMASRERCRQLVHRFLESPIVSEAIKSSSFPVRLKKLIETTMPRLPDNLRAVIETLGLQTPWLMENAETSGIMNVEDLKRHLLIAKQFIQQNSPTQASFLLAPLLFLSANSREDGMLKGVCAVIIEVLEHPLFTHENRDGFFKVCHGFKWPDMDIQDDIFQLLGIGTPKLGKLLSEPEPTVTVDVLQRSLEHAMKHLRSVRSPRRIPNPP